jgi:CheY-like chemotaxis protein
MPQETRTRTILLVDDEEGMRTMLAYVLRNEGYIVIEAGDGCAALAQFSLHRAHHGSIDLVIIDYTMPMMGGITAMQKIHEIEPAAKVLFSCGSNDITAPDECIKKGAVGFLQKPYAIPTFIKTVGEILGNLHADSHNSHLIDRVE